MLLCTVGRMLEAGAFLCLAGCAVRMSPGHTLGFQLARGTALVIMSLNNSAGLRELLVFISWALVSP